MTDSLLLTKLFIPTPRPGLVPRPHLIARMNEGLNRKLTLVSAAAGFGKTTLVSEWIATSKLPTAWLSLDEGDRDVVRFLCYFVAALQTLAVPDSLNERIAPDIGQNVLRALQSPQPPSNQSVLTALLNEIAGIDQDFMLVLDDYHVIDGQAIDEVMTFLLDHLPPQMHLVIATRENPALPVARLRVQGQLTELRASDLRFSVSEAVEFFNHSMGLDLSDDELLALEDRTEGWIAGLQLAAISLKGQEDSSSFIQSFTGSHHFVLDYLLEEVLHQQPQAIQTFLLRTSILNRMCGALCDALMEEVSASGQDTLSYLERANLFIVPLDNKGHWYRYHHLFSELLRQRRTVKLGEGKQNAAEDHIRASQWYEENGLMFEAFQHAALANDIVRAERLIHHGGTPLHSRSVSAAIVDWLASLPEETLDRRPSLWVLYASMLLVSGQTTGVEGKLLAAEAALQGVEEDAHTRDLHGRMATARATLALTRYQADEMIAQSRRALAMLAEENFSFRATANWTLGSGYQFMGNRAAAGAAFREAFSISKTSGEVFNLVLACISLGQIQKSENQLHQAAENFRYILDMAEEQPLQIFSEAHLGLANILYEWNDLESAQKHGKSSLDLANQYDNEIDRFVVCNLFLSRLKIAQGDFDAASDILEEAGQIVHQKNFVHRMPEIAAEKVLLHIRQGNLTEAAYLADSFDLPLSKARVFLARGDMAEAVVILADLRRQMEERSWQDERLRVMVLQALAWEAQGDEERALQVLQEVLVLAEPEGFIRLFIDEGPPMQALLSKAVSKEILLQYTARLLAAFRMEAQMNCKDSSFDILVEPLTERELEVLRHLAQGLSNREIGERLFIALDTVKGHNRRIFAKLQVQRRTEAILRARELGLL